MSSRWTGGNQAELLENGEAFFPAVFDAIRQAQKDLWRVIRQVAEPGGAAAFAALLSGAYKPAPQERVGVLVCGANTVAVDFDR